jgi:hypothetical protein
MFMELLRNCRLLNRSENGLCELLIIWQKLVKLIPITRNPLNVLAEGLIAKRLNGGLSRHLNRVEVCGG